MITRTMTMSPMKRGLSRFRALAYIAERRVGVDALPRAIYVPFSCVFQSMCVPFSCALLLRISVAVCGPSGPLFWRPFQSREIVRRGTFRLVRGVLLLGEDLML